MRTVAWCHKPVWASNFGALLGALGLPFHQGNRPYFCQNLVVNLFIPLCRSSNTFQTSECTHHVDNDHEVAQIVSWHT